MATEVVMPQMGESIAEGTIVRWIKKVGDNVDKDEPLFEISTDKVDAEIPSPGAGVVLDIKVKEGETVPVNSVVAVIGVQGEVGAAGAAGAGAGATGATGASGASGASGAVPVRQVRLVRRVRRRRLLGRLRSTTCGVKSRHRSCGRSPLSTVSTSPN